MLTPMNVWPATISSQGMPNTQAQMTHNGKVSSNSVRVRFHRTRSYSVCAICFNMEGKVVFTSGDTTRGLHCLHAGFCCLLMAQLTSLSEVPSN